MVHWLWFLTDILFKNLTRLLLLEEVFNLEGLGPLGVERVLDLLRPANLLPLPAAAGLDVEDADGVRRPGKAIAFAKSPV